MRGFRQIALLLGVLVSAVVPVTALAQATPEATPAANCPFPPISADLLREMRGAISESPPPTPTPPEVGLTSDRTHLLAFPPPPGDPIDDATADSIRRFIAAYADCVEIGRIAPVYGAWTEDYIRRSLGSDTEYVDALIRVIEMEPETPLLPHPGISLLLLRAWHIETGHVVAVVQIVGAQQFWTMLLLPHGDSWRIDDLWSRGPRSISDNLSGPVYATPIPEP